ncbi:MAG: GNAT family protein [Lachnospiraceae bacterium]|nr:GNAT family protein [Lachnospiraceae bacterium]
MNHKGTRTIETKRLILRKFCKEDAKNMYENWASDSEVTKYLMWPAHSSEKVSEEYIGMLLDSYQLKDYYDWAIELKELGQVIGSIGIVNKNDVVESVHVGYCVGKKWWNQGLTSEAFQAIIPFLFEEVGVKRIESRHDTNNENSGKVMKKCGLKYEGTLRNSDHNNQGICDAAWYALLREEYEEMKSGK